MFNLAKLTGRKKIWNIKCNRYPESQFTLQDPLSTLKCPPFKWMNLILERIWTRNKRNEWAYVEWNLLQLAGYHHHHHYRVLVLDRCCSLLPPFLLQLVLSSMIEAYCQGLHCLHHRYLPLRANHCLVVQYKAQPYCTLHLLEALRPPAGCMTFKQKKTMHLKDRLLWCRAFLQCSLINIIFIVLQRLQIRLMYH